MVEALDPVPAAAPRVGLRMNLVVVSHKVCWRSESSPTGYATDGGFALQMRALSELFNATTLLVPVSRCAHPFGEVLITGNNLSVNPLPLLKGRNGARKLQFPFWLLRSSRLIWRELRRADCAHTPIPGDVGTAGMIMAMLLKKPLLVRHCGNWTAPRTIADHFWIWLMSRFAGGRNVMFATGSAPNPPCPLNPEIHWIFATSLCEAELAALTARHPSPRPGNAPRLIIACRQEAGKGTDVVIRALPQILKEFPLTTLEVAGDGSALEGFKALACDVGVARQVTFHGNVDHGRVIELLQGADLLCYPTTSSEGFPKIVLEAFACGLPVVSTPVSALRSLIGKERGVLLMEANPHAVADAVKYCLEEKERYQRMSVAAVAAARHYSLEAWRDTIGERLATAWGQLCAHE